MKNVLCFTLIPQSPIPKTQPKRCMMDPPGNSHNDPKRECLNPETRNLNPKAQTPNPNDPHGALQFCHPMLSGLSFEARCFSPDRCVFKSLQRPIRINQIDLRGLLGYFQVWGQGLGVCHKGEYYLQCLL